MAWKHRQRRANSNDIIDPEDWTANLREFADEANGFLDRDNFRDREIVHEIVKEGCFSKVRVVRTKEDYVLDGTTTSFQSPSLLKLEFTEPTNGMLIAECSGSFQFLNGRTYSNSMFFFPEPQDVFDRLQFSKLKTANSPDAFDNEGFQIVSIRLLVDGVEIGRAHCIPEFTQRQSFYVCGAAPIETGTHRVEVEAKTCIKENYLDGDEIAASSDGASRTVRFWHSNLLVTVRRR